MKNNNATFRLFPVLFGFFIMGFVDLVGIATNYVKADFHLSDSLANLLPLMVFLWFAVFSVPTGLLMNRIGRKKTVLLSLLITFVAMLIPLLDYHLSIIMIAFALIGIANTLLQVSLNPLLSDVVSQKKLTSSLTLGQFIKAIASFLGPVIAGWAAFSLGNWKFIFPIFAIITLISLIWLHLTSIQESKVTSGDALGFRSCFALLKDSMILLLFIGIIFVVGIDVGLNTTVPKILIERCHMPLAKAGLGTSLYFVARTISAFLGAIILLKVKSINFFKVSMILALLSLIILVFARSMELILAMVFLEGFFIANIFSIIYSLALQRMPGKANEISGLMIMGVAGGAVLPPVMGLLSDSMGQTGGLLVLLVAVIYLLACSFLMRASEKQSL